LQTKKTVKSRRL